MNNTKIEIRIRSLANGRSDHEAQHIRRVVTKALKQRTDERTKQDAMGSVEKKIHCTSEGTTETH